MLAFHTMKRARDDDSDSDDDRYFKVRVSLGRIHRANANANTKHLTRIQKSRPFAFHGFHNGHTSFPSPSSRPFQPALTPSPPRVIPNLETMTPAHSDHSEANSPASLHEDQPSFSSPRHVEIEMDMDMDEEDFDIIGSPPLDPPYATNFLRPAKLNFDASGDRDSANTGRIPTPIYPTFGGHRGPMITSGMSGLGYPSSGLAGGMSLGNTHPGVPSYPILQQPPPSRKPPQIDQDRSRRMPSPISEDEDLPDTPTALTQSQLSRLSVTSNAERMDVEEHDSDGQSGLAPPGVVTTPTRGRKRSGALSGRGRFTMGYRDDCEKCRQRIPGHYSHFLP